MSNVQSVEAKVIGSVRLRSRRKLVEYACGHRFNYRFILVIHGGITRMTDKFWKERPMCGCCALKDRSENVIRCGRCGLPIYADDSVAVLPVDFRKEWPGYAVIVNGLGGKRVMTCLRRGCAPPTAIDGTWTKHGFERFNAAMQRPGIF